MKKREGIILIIALVLVFLTSALVPDSRTFTTEKPLIFTAAKKTNGKIETAHFLTDREYTTEDNVLEELTSTKTIDYSEEDSKVEESIDEEIKQAQIEDFTEEQFDDNALAQSEEQQEIYIDDDEEDDSTGQGLIYLGTYEATAYEWTGNPCANGNYPQEGYTIACNSLPLGTEVYIDGMGWYVVEDRGASWHSDSWVDIFMGDVNSCYEWGRRYVDLYIQG